MKDRGRQARAHHIAFNFQLFERGCSCLQTAFGGIQLSELAEVFDMFGGLLHELGWLVILGWEKKDSMSYE